jgi:hypothetical protein
MRGKKKHPEFVADYIEKCSQFGISNLNEISNLARQEIIDIDAELYRINELKKRRSLLLNVIESLINYES